MTISRAKAAEVLPTTVLTAWGTQPMMTETVDEAMIMPACQMDDESAGTAGKGHGARRWNGPLQWVGA